MTSDQLPVPPTDGLLKEGHSSSPPALAGFWRRFVALAIDLVIIFFCLYLVTLAASVSYEATHGSAAWGTVSFFLISYLFYNLFFIVYLVYFIAGSGQTPGKMAVGVKVVDLSGGNAGYMRAIFRAFGYYISSSIFMAGFLWSLVDRRRQTWHDKLAGTVVVEI